MFTKHLSMYALARGIPGIINFASIAIFTRLIDATEIGKFVVTIAIISLGQMLIYQWLHLAVVRLYEESSEKEKFLSTVIVTFGALSLAVTMIAAAILMLALVGPAQLIVIAAVLLIVQGWFELTLFLASARLDPVRYGLLSGSKALLALAFGTAGALAGFGAAGLLLASCAAQIVAFAVHGRGLWRGCAMRHFDREACSVFARYGVPATLTFGLTWIIASSDRLVIGALLDIESAGIYGVSYDLAAHSLGLALMIVSSASIPLVISAYNRNGPEEARKLLAFVGEVVFAVGSAGAALFWVLQDEIVAVVLGEPFRAGAKDVIVIIAVAAAINAMKTYYFDLGFHLASSLKRLVQISAGIAVLNVA